MLEVWVSQPTQGYVWGDRKADTIAKATTEGLNHIPRCLADAAVNAEQTDQPGGYR